MKTDYYNWKLMNEKLKVYLHIPRFYSLISKFKHESLSRSVEVSGPLKEGFKRYCGIDVRKAFSNHDTRVSLLALLFHLALSSKTTISRGNLDKMTVLAMSALQSASMLLVDEHSYGARPPIK